MKITFNPSTVAALTTPPNNKDITFDLRGRNIFARGVKFYGTDTNTWRDIKINNVSIGSYTLDLQNGSNTTLTNTNGVVTINSTWRPVVDNLTSDSTTSSLSAKQGKVLKALIDGKSNSDHNHDGRYVKKSGDTMSGVLTIDTPNFGALTIKRNDDANGASIQFRGKSSVYGYIGLDNSTKDKQFLRWSSDTYRSYTILDTSSTYISNGKGVINGTTITQVDNATNSTNSTNARKLVNWYSARPTSLNAQFGDGSLRIFYATSSTTEGKPAEDSHILHLAWDNTSGWDAQLAVHLHSGKVSTRVQTGGTWQPWKTLAFTTDIPTSLKNPYSFNVFGVVYDGSAAKTVTTSTFISQVTEGTSTITDGTMLITSYASDSGFADTNAVNVPYKRKAIHLWEYIKTKTDSLYATKGHTHDDRYYTKAESNAKYITDITTSVNKLTFTRNGSNIIRDITVNVVHSQGRLTNIPNKDATTKASLGLLIYDSYEQTIGTNSYSSVLSINTGGTIQIAGNWGDNQTRNLYWRSQSDGAVSSYPWKSWRTILDSENYSSTLDSRYYTESEVNSLLDAKLNRQNLSYGNWNPRGYHLAADYHYNGGDLSISESGGKIHVSVNGYFWQNEGQYRVLDTSDVAGLKSDLTVHQYLSATDAAWYPLVWGGNYHNNTSDSTGIVYKSYDKLSWQTSSQTLYATNIQTNNIKNLSIGGGIYWNPYVEAATDGSDAASITLVRSGVAGGTTLVLSQMNDTNDTIQFKTNTAARLYHNSYPILTTQNTYVSNNKGYINGTEITQVNNSDKVDNRHAISTTPNTGIIYKAAIYTISSLTSYWVRLASIPSISQNDEFVATIHVQSGHFNPGRSAILLVYLRGDASSFMSKSFKICCNSNYNPNRFRLYYKDSDKTSEIWYQTTGQWDGIITTVISQSAEGSLHERLTLYSGNIDAVQTPSVSTYLSAQVSTITDNISGNASTATKLQTARSIWGQSFDGTGNVSGSLSEVGNIHFKVDDSYDIGSDAVASRHIYTHWLGARSGRKLELGANNSGFGQGLCIDTNLNVGIGTNTPAYKLDVKGDIYSSGYVRASSGFIKGSSSDSYVLLGGGGHKLESSLKVAYSKYLTGIAFIGGDGNNEGYRLIFEKTMGGWAINYGVWAIAFRHSGRGTLNIGFDTTNSDGSTYTYNIRFLGSTASRESTPFRAFYNSTTKVFRIYWHYWDYASGDIAVLRGNIEPHSGTWMTSLPNDVGTELAITCNMADQATNADTVDGYHATDGRTFNGDIHWGSWNDVWSDGTHTHPWYGFDHRYPNTGVYSTTISDYFGMTIKTHNTLLLDCETLLLNSRNNVGIGTTSPTQKLDVIGNIRATGQIIREGYSNRWVYGRNVALLRETSAVGYHTLWSLKTTNGSWDFGEYNEESDWNNIPVLSYITDSNYNSGNNATTYQIKFPLASGTVALTSNIPNPTNYYWANVKISASSSTTTSPTFSNVYLGNSLYLNNRGSASIYNGPNDSANGVGGPLNNLVFSSWQGVSFTTSCAGFTYTNKNAVSINCRTGQLYAREVQANGFIHTGHNNNDAVLLAGGDYKTLNSIWGGDSTHFVFLGYLDLYRGQDGTISSTFYCLGYSVPFTYTRGGNYCKVVIPDTERLSFYIVAATASVNYSGGGMDTWTGNHRGAGAWWLHCYAFSRSEVRVKGFCQANSHNDSWWGGNPLWDSAEGANRITVCIFGYVKYK